MNAAYLICYMIVDVFCIVLALIVTMGLRSDSGSEMQVKYFRRLLVAYFAFVISDLIWTFIMISGVGAHNHILSATFNGMNKIAMAFAAYFWFCYGQSHFGSPFVYNKTGRTCAAIPVLLVPILYIVGFIFDLNFVVTPEGDGIGPTYIAITAIGLGYLFAATVDALIHFRRAKTRALQRPVRSSAPSRPGGVATSSW